MFEVSTDSSKLPHKPSVKVFHSLVDFCLSSSLADH